MNSGYIWPVSYTRSGKNGKCETLKMEVQLALYSESKNLLLYFAETDNRELSKTIKRILYEHRERWNIELSASNKKLGFLQIVPIQQLFIVNFHTVSEAYDCVALLKQFHYNVFFQKDLDLPKVLPSPLNELPPFPPSAEEISESSSAAIPSRLVIANTDELRVAIMRIRSDPHYVDLLSKVQTILSSAI